jgi:hypothetical protein
MNLKFYDLKFRHKMYENLYDLPFESKFIWTKTKL